MGMQGVWLRQAGILLLHLGLILILMGGGIYAARGETSYIHLFAGDVLDLSRVLDVRHPFAIQFHDFEIEFYADGSPSQYISRVSVLEQGQKVRDVPISVNNPLSYQGVKLYQNSFGYLIEVKHTGKNGIEQTSGCMEGDLLAPANTNRVVKIYRYLPHYNPAYGMNPVTMRPDNPRLIYSIYEEDRMLGVGAAPLDEPVYVDENAYFIFSGVELYTILQIKSDPGLPLVTAGGIVLMLGIGLAYWPTRDKKARLKTSLGPGS